MTNSGSTFKSVWTLKRSLGIPVQQGTGYNGPGGWGRWVAWVLGEHGDLKCYMSTPPLGTPCARDEHESLDEVDMMLRDEIR